MLTKKRLESKRAWQAKNIEKVRRYAREYYYRKPKALRQKQRKEWYKNNRSLSLAGSKRRRLVNLEKYKQVVRNWYYNNRSKSLALAKKYQEDHPWLSHLYSAKTRCTNPKCDKYSYYGGRGIRCLLSPAQVKSLYIRDQAHLMKFPSIDRINNDGNYTLRNCRFTELSDNSRKRGA